MLEISDKDLKSIDQKKKKKLQQSYKFTWKNSQQKV